MSHAEPHHTEEAQHSMSLAAWIGFFLGPAFLLLTFILPAPEGMSEIAWRVVGLTLLMATWWSTEAIPIPITSLLPILLVPALGIASLRDVTAPYANPIIFLFLGGFLLGLAMQRWNLHRRIALLTLLAVGDQPARQIAGFMLATGFISMWVSNTATAIMMLPIGLSIISLMESDNEAELERFATALLLAIAYAASIGGVATLIGTPPNALLAGYLADNQGIQLGFGEWMLIGLPVSILMMGITWWWLSRKPFDIKGNSKAMLQEELRKMGPMTKAEKLVALVFVLAALAWVVRPMLNTWMPWLSDTGIAMAAAIALFMIPVDIKKRVFLMSWDKADAIPWGVLLLFGGGLALAGMISSSGLAVWIANGLGGLSTLPLLLTIALVVAVILFLTEVTSNTATAAAFLPLLGALAVAQDLSPLLYTVPAAIAASCAFMLPVATPPNAIVFGTGHMKISSMIRTGAMLNLTGIVIVTLACYYLVVGFWL
ncbi:DASS family sodium-coupled anion symporter [Marinospirillum sp. MEB164]|uniref:DASS family sodium-coupled anion symporter n=1 Tax=Marinospirillum alkalitolerans TaxID=3123374 RepID=A0ABW8PZS8_9GAMM